MHWGPDQQRACPWAHRFLMLLRNPCLPAVWTHVEQLGLLVLAWLGAHLHTVQVKECFPHKSTHCSSGERHRARLGNAGQVPLTRTHRVIAVMFREMEQKMIQAWPPARKLTVQQHRAIQTVRGTRAWKETTSKRIFRKQKILLFSSSFRVTEKRAEGRDVSYASRPSPSLHLDPHLPAEWCTCYHW